MSIKEKIKSDERLKKIAFWMLMPSHDPRPRWWLRNFVNPFKHKKGKGTKIRRFARLDTFPYNEFVIGERSLVEDYTIINNAVGDVIIGSEVVVGMGTVLIGPLQIGNDVILAQHIVISGLNHGFTEMSLPFSKQKVECKKITIENNVWIGANCVVTSGVTISKNSIIGAGSVVTKDIPPYSIAVGNPAKVVKRYNIDEKKWEPVIQSSKDK